MAGVETGELCPVHKSTIFLQTKICLFSIFLYEFLCVEGNAFMLDW